MELLEVGSGDLREGRRMIVVLECLLVQLTFSVHVPGIVLDAKGTVINKMDLFFVLFRGNVRWSF